MKRALTCASLLATLDGCYDSQLFTEPLLNPIAGTYREIGVLTCPDYREVPREVETTAASVRLSAIDEVVFQNELSAFDQGNFVVNYWIFEELISGFWATFHTDTSWTDQRRGTLELSNVVLSNSNEAWVPRTLDTQGTFIMRTDGKLELRDIWLGPDQTAADAIWLPGATMFVDGQPAAFDQVYCGHVLAR